MNRESSIQQTTHERPESVPTVSSVAMSVECVMPRIRLNLNASFRSRATLVTAACNDEFRAPVVTRMVSKENELRSNKACTCFQPILSGR